MSDRDLIQALRVGGQHEAADRLEELTKADVAPVRRGVWESIRIPNQWDKGRCSACKNIFGSSQWGTKYCPVCGARMDGGADDA